MSRRRRWTARALTIAASLSAVLAVVFAYVQFVVVDSDQFANRATAALRDESVRSLIAERITDEVVLKNEGDLLAARPIIENVTASMVGGRAFTGLFRAGVHDVHRGLFDRDQHTVTLTVADIGTVLAGALRYIRPSLAEQVRVTDQVELYTRNLGTVSEGAARAANLVRVTSGILLLATLLTAAGALALSRDRRRTVVELGIGVAAAGVVLVVACGAGRSLAVEQLSGVEEQTAARTVWDAFLGDLLTTAWILAGSGAVIAAAAASLIRPVDLAEPLKRAARVLTTEPTRPALRGLRAGGLILAGLMFLLGHELVIQLLFALVGIYLIYAGVSALLWLVYKPRAAQDEAVATARGRRRKAIAAGAVAVVLIGGTASAFVGSGAATTEPPVAGPCNGHAELCDRPLTDVALPATHNSMSAPLDGWFSSEQDESIADQLHHGIRGLLIDTHYAERIPNGRLRTDVAGVDLVKQARADGVSEASIEAALRFRDRLGFAGSGERGMYLCHTFCELGGTSLESVLRDLRDFLVANPGEVVVVINQDYVEPADFVGAVVKAGLDRLAYTGPAGGRWPTLRELIDTGQRVVFLAENRAGAARWYRPAFPDITQETPWSFSKVAQLVDPVQVAASCRPNRGNASAPLFLVNHWITTDPLPKPSDAEEVNAFRPLLARLRECRRVRGRMPNLVAVNFARRGELLHAVDALNGLRP